MRRGAERYRKKTLALPDGEEDVDAKDWQLNLLRNVGTFGVDLLMRKFMGIDPDALDDEQYAKAVAEIEYLTESAVNVVAAAIGRALGGDKKGK